MASPPTRKRAQDDAEVYEAVHLRERGRKFVRVAPDREKALEYGRVDLMGRRHGEVVFAQLGGAGHLHLSVQRFDHGRKHGIHHAVDATHRVAISAPNPYESKRGYSAVVTDRNGEVHLRPGAKTDVRASLRTSGVLVVSTYDGKTLNRVHPDGKVESGDTSVGYASVVHPKPAEHKDGLWLWKETGRFANRSLVEGVRIKKDAHGRVYKFTEGDVYLPPPEAEATADKIDVLTDMLDRQAATIAALQKRLDAMAPSQNK